MSRELVSQIIGIARITAQGCRHRTFRLAVQIRIGRIKIIHAALDRQIKHRIDLVLVDLAAFLIHDKAHAAKAQAG